MRGLFYRFTFAVTISALVVFLAGCAIGIRPRDDNEIPEDTAYYEEPVYDSYYGTGYNASPHYYDPNYDPWTMGTYYQHYSGPPRTDSSGSSSASSTKPDNRRPAVKGRDSTSSYQSKAPNSGTTSIKRSKSGSTTTNRTRSESSASSITQRKTKRDTTRGTTGTSQKRRPANESQVKQRKTQVQSSSQKSSRSSTKQEEEDEENE